MFIGSHLVQAIRNPRGVIGIEDLTNLRERETMSSETDCGLTFESFLNMPNRAFSYYFRNPGLNNGNTFPVQ